MSKRQRYKIIVASVATLGVILGTIAMLVNHNLLNGGLQSTFWMLILVGWAVILLRPDKDEY